MDILFTCAFGMITVFIGLTCIIALCELMHIVYAKLTSNATQAPVATAKPTSVTSAPAPKNAEIPNRQEFIAAVSAAIAEELGTDVSAISILSVKKL